MKRMPRSTGTYSTSAIKTNFSRIGTTWTRNGEDIFLEQEEKRSWRDNCILSWLKYRPIHGWVGCGAGNTIFPLLSTNPDIFAHACDFSPRAVNIVKMHKEFSTERVNAFVCDLAADDLTQHISPSSVDVVTMIFVLSAVSPEKMPSVLQNIRKVLKPDGHVLFRDYATGDLAQERLTHKEQKISENFYVRGDGTRAFYFSDEFLASLFRENGFGIEEHVVCCKQVENRSRELVMNRRWVQAVFSAGLNSNNYCEDISQPKIKDITPRDAANGSEIDIPDEMVAEMFGITYSSEEIIEVGLKDYYSFKIKVLSKEYQHTCKSTGLMLWESARLMASVLATNPTIVDGKRVLELGCGCAGICSMVAASRADIVVATDGDARALDLLNQNVDSNVSDSSLGKLIAKRLEWGNKDDIEAIKKINNLGFDVIIGTDVTYVAEAITPLFATAKELIAASSLTDAKSKPALIFCHVFRRVDEPSILAAASQFGFKLVDRWPERTSSGSCQKIINSWFSGDISEKFIPTAALNIMYFQRE
ncbi:hypothetical protein Leryth_004974 [Lithospermum erythrorhizon]|nr:hypothetical protein Leryth_004974 [Lithospermum erythrorhizon]